MASMMSDGHSTAQNLSRMECLNEWMTQLFGTTGFSHLLIAAETGLALLDEVRGKLKLVYGVFFKVWVNCCLEVNNNLNVLHELVSDIK